MPSNLHHFGLRPSKISKSQWQGAGWYSHRGKGDWAKWSRSHDLKRGSTRHVGVGATRHMNDTMKRRRHRRRR